MSDEEYVYDSGEDWDEEQEGEHADDTQVEVENSFYEADGTFHADLKKTDPQRALGLFQRVLELEASLPAHEQQWRFKALRNIIVLQCALGLHQEMCKAHVQLLELMETVARNDATEAINNIIDVVSGISNSEVSMKIYVMTIECLKRGKNERLLFTTQAKLAKLFLDKEMVAQAEETIAELLVSCRMPDGSDDLKKGQSLLEAYALQIQLCSLTKNSKLLKEIYHKTENLSADIADPRIMGIIKESGSKMYMGEKQWDKALTEFFEAFKCYQEVGNQRAKTILKYVVLASILSNSNINPFHSQEAKVYKDDTEILAMMRLRGAYEAKDITELQAVLSDRSASISTDPFIALYLDDLLRTVRLNVLQNLIKPYRTVRMQSLASDLNITEALVTSLVVELILDGKVQGQIDQVKGFLELKSQESSQAGNRKYKAIQKWVKSLRQVQTSLLDKLKQ